MAQIYVHRNGTMTNVASFRPLLRRSLARGITMDASMIDPSKLATCRWVNWGISKGVTHRTENISVMGVPDQLKRGLHGELIQGFDGVDQTPRCYDVDAKLGFGDFVRWVYFTDPDDHRSEGDVLGIDWSCDGRPSHGIATTMTDVVTIAQRLIDHGIPLDAELVLLDWHMLEPTEMRDWRIEFNLRCLEDWSRGDVFAPDGPLCLDCGSQAFESNESFCHHCGHARPRHKGDSHVLETRIA